MFRKAKALRYLYDNGREKKPAKSVITLFHDDEEFSKFRKEKLLVMKTPFLLQEILRIIV